MADVESEGPIRISDLEERQGLKQIEDSVLDLQIVFASTLDTIDTLIQNYGIYQRRLKGHKYDSTTLDDDLLHMALVEKRRDLLLFVVKLDALRSKVSGTSQLVLSSDSRPVSI